MIRLCANRSIGVPRGIRFRFVWKQRSYPACKRLKGCVSFLRVLLEILSHAFVFELRALLVFPVIPELPVIPASPRLPASPSVPASPRHTRTPRHSCLPPSFLLLPRRPCLPPSSLPPPVIPAKAGILTRVWTPLLAHRPDPHQSLQGTHIQPQIIAPLFWDMS